MHVTIEWKFMDNRPTDWLKDTDGIVDVSIERVLVVLFFLS